MKGLVPALVFALLAASNTVTSRVVPLSKAPYVRRDIGFSNEVASQHDVPAEAGRSIIHNRVTRHIRVEDEQDRLQRRAAAAAADDGSITNFNGSDPAPVRGAKGAPFLHSSNTAIDKQNPDNVSPPPTDAGTVPNLKWSFSQSHTRLLKGGWVREQTVTDLPSSTEIAGAEQRLAPYAYRELHWHRVAEWAYVLNGTVRITGNDENGANYVADVQQGDLWSFPLGVPHSLQAGPNGAEYLLVFDDGNFDATGTTFMVDDWIAHTPTEILAQNFGWNESVFGSIPSPDPYLVPADSWPSLQDAQQAVKTNEQGGEVKSPYYYALSQQNETKAPGGGGWVKIVDRNAFPASETLAAALVHVEPGALRELHWHKQSEWGYVISGKGRATAFAGGATARTFDLQAGDTWTFPTNYGHYIHNYDDKEPLVFLELFRAGTFGQPVNYNDFPLSQWLGLTPPEVVARNLNVSIDLVKELKKDKQILVAKRG